MRTCLKNLRSCGAIVLPLLIFVFMSAGSVWAVDVTLAWNETLASDLAGYKLYYRTCPAGDGCASIGAVGDLSTLTVPLSELADRQAPEYIAKGLPSDSDFVFVVTAYTGSSSESGFSNETLYRAPVVEPNIVLSSDEQPPTTPVQLQGSITADANGDGIVLTWAKSADDTGVSAYAVYRDGVYIGETGNTDYIDTDGVAGTTYAYTIAALDAAGNMSTMSEPLVVTLPSAEEVPAAQPVSVTIDDNDAGATSSGRWQKSGGIDPYATQSLYSKEVGATYTYQSILSGQYDISVWWTAYRSRCTSVPVEIYDDGYLLDTVYVNQRVDGGQWNFLGTYAFNGKASVVVVSDDSGCSTCADAIEFINNNGEFNVIDNSGESTVIDNNDAGTTLRGNWKKSGGVDPYGTQSLYSKEVGATYTYKSTLSGQYDLEMWWTPYKSRCTSVPVEIYDDGHLLDRVYVNQRVNGGQWNFLGTYEFSGQVKLVVVSDDSGCSTCADAIRYLK